MNLGLDFQLHEEKETLGQAARPSISRSAMEEIENNKWRGRKRLQSILRPLAIISLIGLMIVRFYM